ncbi:hypothetical protein M3Y99_01631500 [Aphelenchoides fujianensis]|nr:hypothetical protein M3Y99_01631500 [Aphelenchoides fujianensis]
MNYANSGGQSEASARLAWRRKERVIFEECWRGGKNVLQLAKCVAAVLDARDRLRLHDAPPPADPRCADDDAQGGWLMGNLPGAPPTVVSNALRPLPPIEWAKKGAPHAVGESSFTPSIPADFNVFDNDDQEVAARSTAFSPPNRPSSTNSTALPTSSGSTLIRRRTADSPPLSSRSPVRSGRKRSSSDLFGFSASPSAKRSSSSPPQPPPPLRYFQRKRINKRSLPEVSPRCGTPANVRTLRQLQQQFHKLNHVIRYLHSVTKSNQKFLEQVDMKVDYRSRPSGRGLAVGPSEAVRRAAREFRRQERSEHPVTKAAQFAAPRSRRSRLQTMAVAKHALVLRMRACYRSLVFSRCSTSDHCETMAWLDLLMDLTGAKRISGCTRACKRSSDTTEIRIAPEATTLEQERELDIFGYAKMNADQLRIAYGREGLIDAPTADFSHDAEADRIFDEDIRALSRMTEADLIRVQQKYKQIEEEHRRKRQAPVDPLEAILPMTHQQQLFGYRVLNGFAFTTRIRNSNVMGPYILSPYAFYLQIVSPSVLHVSPPVTFYCWLLIVLRFPADVISPRAFIASIFSPVVLTARILAPSAFRLMARLMSPLALTFWVTTRLLLAVIFERLQTLVPEAFLAKIMSPKFLDARILSPGKWLRPRPSTQPFGCFRVLLRSFCSRRQRGSLAWGSPNAMNFLVLSPSFGSYQLWSGNRHVVQVLSPGILGLDSHPLLKEDPEKKFTGVERPIVG